MMFKCQKITFHMSYGCTMRPEVACYLSVGCNSNFQ